MKKKYIKSKKVKTVKEIEKDNIKEAIKVGFTKEQAKFLNKVMFDYPPKDY